MNRTSTVLILALLFPMPIWANAGPPAQGGQIVGEPYGFKDVGITHEKLTIDLRPLEHGEQALVEARYALLNRGKEHTLDLVFATGARVGQFQVKLDGAAVTSAAAPGVILPAKWQPPAATPGIDAVRDVSYLKHGSHSVTPMAFRITVPAGKHELTVSYSAEAAQHSSGQATRYWQMAYSLAPAREWASFGGLDVSIRLPPDWLVATTPSLTRDGDELAGAFTQLPGDAIAITTRAPAPGANLLCYGGLALFLATLALGPALGGWLSWRRGRAVAQLPPTSPWLRRSAFAWSLLVGFLLANGVFFAGLFAISGSSLVVPARQSDINSGYGAAWAFFGLVVLCLLLLPMGAVLGLVPFLIARARSGRA